MKKAPRARRVAAAAALLAGSLPPDHLAAGRLWLEKVRKSALAVARFQQGWACRPRDSRRLCAIELARLDAERGALGPILTLLEEADALFDDRPVSHSMGSSITR